MTVLIQLLELDTTQAKRHTARVTQCMLQTLKSTCHGDNLQARKVAEQSLTETAESGMSR